MNMRHSRRQLLIGVGGAIAGGPLIRPGAAAEGTPAAADMYEPTFDPANFGTVIDNPYFPLIPGTVSYYEGESDGEPETEVITVQLETREVMGVTCVVLQDDVSVNGEVVESTIDWYAQDLDGIVWYMGEESKDYEDGVLVSTEGSWEAGVDGALPGVYMMAEPEIGAWYRQERYANEAEDIGTVIKLGETITVPYGSFENVLVTEDINPLHPEFIEHKYYAPGVGLVMAEAVAGGSERIELVRVETGAATPEASPGA